jgi:hypothetical protein
MSSKEKDKEAKNEAFVVHHTTVKVEEEGGRKFVKFVTPKALQGHTFALEFTPEGQDVEPLGPYRIEYILTSDFFVHESILASSVDLESGRSYLRLGSGLQNVEQIHLRYSDSNNPSVVHTAEMTLQVDAGIIQGLIVINPEQNIEAAIRNTNQIVSDMLDAISFYKRVPIQVRHIKVQALGSEKYLRQYVTVPYSTVDVETSDCLAAANEPRRLRPCLRLFREAINSSKPHYRLLCLYRIREVLDRLRSENDTQIIAAGRKPARPDRRITDNEFTRTYFPSFIGKRVRAFLDHVREEYRLPVAHANLSELWRLVLDPADVRVDHRVDYTTAMVIQVISQLVEDERALILSEGLQ